MIGTVRFSLVNSINHPALREALELMATKPHGSWCLVTAFDEV